MNLKAYLAVTWKIRKIAKISTDDQKLKNDIKFAISWNRFGTILVTTIFILSYFIVGVDYHNSGFLIIRILVSLFALIVLDLIGILFVSDKFIYIYNHVKDEIE